MKTRHLPLFKNNLNNLMRKVPLSKIKIESKLAIVRDAISELEKIGIEFSQEEFERNKEKFAVAEHFLRRALEAVFDIGGHIISRFPYSPGKRPKTFKEEKKGSLIQNLPKISLWRWQGIEIAWFIFMMKSPRKSCI